VEWSIPLTNNQIPLKLAKKLRWARKVAIVKRVTEEGGVALNGECLIVGGAFSNGSIWAQLYLSDALVECYPAIICEPLKCAIYIFAMNVV